MASRPSRYSVAIEIMPDIFSPNYFKIFNAWEKRAFGRRALTELLRATIDAGDAHDEYFVLDEISRGGVWISDSLLVDIYRRPHPWGVQFRSAKTTEELYLHDDELQTVGDILRSTGRWAGGTPPSHIALKSDIEECTEDVALIKLLLDGCESGLSYGTWPRPQAPGIYRREHASVALRSSTTTLLVDPQQLSSSWTTNNGLYPADYGWSYDGILLTHGHSDHWHAPSILHAAKDPAVPVIVPEVTQNMLSPEHPAQTLALLGQRVFAPPWGASVKIGDFDIQILPFYGEQPTRHPPGVDRRLRNWGNCYRIACPEFSAILLVDSGVDPEGSMIDVLTDSAATHGPVDVVLSCCGAFPEAINPGLPMYAFALPIQRIEEILAERRTARARSMTLGPDGLAEACNVSGARCFLPYAHGFQGVGVDPNSTDSSSAAELSVELKAKGAKTQLVDWRPGDAWVVEDGNYFVHRGAR